MVGHLKLDFVPSTARPNQINIKKAVEDGARSLFVDSLTC